MSNPGSMLERKQKSEGDLNVFVIISLTVIFLGSVFTIFDFSTPVRVPILVNCIISLLGVRFLFSFKSVTRSRSYVLLNPTLYVIIGTFTLFGLFPLLTIANSEEAFNSQIELFPTVDWLTSVSSTISLGNCFLSAYLITSALLLNRRLKAISIENLPVRRMDKDRYFENNHESPLNVPWMLVILYLIYGVAGLFIWRLSANEFFLFGTRSRINASGSTYQNGYIYGSHLIIGGVASALLVINLYNKKMRISTVVLLILSVLPSLITGNRSFVILLLLLYLSIILSFGRKPIKFILLAFLGLPFLIISPRLFRAEQNLSLHSLFAGYSFKEISESFTGLDAGMLPSFSALNAAILSNSIPLQYGKSYISFFVQPIPRSFFPQKPLAIDLYLNSEIYPSTSRYVGFAFSGLSEPYVNFGLVGILGFGILLAFLNFKAFLNMASYSTFSTLKIYVSCWWLAFIPLLIRGNLTTDLPRILFPSLPGLSILYLAEILNKRHE